MADQSNVNIIIYTIINISVDASKSLCLLMSLLELASSSSSINN